jgi:hypothetical protein
MTGISDFIVFHLPSSIAYFCSSCFLSPYYIVGFDNQPNLRVLHHELVG